MTPQFAEGTLSFGFDSVAFWNLQTSEKILASDEGKRLSEHEVASIYASMLFNLYVYLEGNINQGLKYLHRIEPKNKLLRDLILERTKWNVHPFEVLKWLDIEFGSTLLGTVQSRHQEPFRFHNDLRNLIAHGGVVRMDALHEWGEGFQTNIVEPDKELRKLIEFYKKNDIYQKTEAHDGYVTTIATQRVFDFFKSNCSSFVSALIQGPDAGLARTLFWSFNYTYFGLSHPGNSHFGG